ncbi:MAG: hypothetical protein LBI05_01285 [Planctomycetaceae bacterium]|jgi:hypothetical protein|nr:hypothetical protein [Planctomycetaceae bacterium]
MDSEKQDVLSMMGTLGFDVEDVRILFPMMKRTSDAKIEEGLKRGKALHRLNVSAKLYGIIDSPATNPRDLIAAERHLRDVHAKASTQTGAQELLNLLRGTVPALPPPDYENEEDDDNEV